MENLQVNNPGTPPSDPLGPLVSNRFGDRYLFQVNRERFDRLGSTTLYRESFADFLSREDTLFVVVGTDSGLLPAFVKGQGLAEGVRVLFVELPAVLERLKEESALVELENRLAYATPADWQERAAALKMEHFLFLDNVRLVRSFAAEDACLAEYRELYWSLEQAINQNRWEVNAGFGSELFVRRQLENLAENRTHINALGGLFAGKTAVLLGGGPSLDEILPWLQANREKVAVIAVSRVCRRLLEVGMAPDVIVAIDPKSLLFDNSKEMLEFWETSLFVNAYHVVPTLLGQWRGKSAYIGPRFPWRSPLNIKSPITLGPTVTNVAFDTAVEMGFAQIVLAGVDLCFSKDGHTHAKGSSEREAGPRLGMISPQVVTNGGDLADTDHAFSCAVDVFGHQAQRALERGSRVVNFAAAAARIPHVDFLPLEAIDLEPLEQAAAVVIAERLPAASADHRSGHYHEVLDELGRANGQLRKIKKLSLEALKVVDRIFGRGRNQPDFRLKGRLDKIENTLNQDFEDFERLLKKLGIRSFIKITSADEDQAWEKEKVEQVGRVYYEAYRDSAERLLKLVEKAQQRLRSRLEEEKPAPDFRSLLAQWRQDHQPGRFLVWQALHSGGDRSIPPELGEELQGLTLNFQNILGETETAMLKKCREFADLSGVRSKALVLFRRKDRAPLEHLAEALGQHSDPAARPLLFLVRGYLAELDGDAATAFEEYQQLIDEGAGPVLEDALQQIAALSIELGEPGNAITAFDCLAAMSPVYMPIYADLLRKVGETDRSLDVYADYLERFPDDLTTSLTLAGFYKELKIDEGVRLMCDHVLSKDPRNRAARILVEELEGAASA